ncbi:MAG: hypothetical protein BWY82_00963 [Verrucomicrobia bacterium ADurb.Bin474]|nr:MAG: hypothetical protein BWY82_00963 [Verrucomicrobia bacterium ADurb.Bin474]
MGVLKVRDGLECHFAGFDLRKRWIPDPFSPKTGPWECNDFYPAVDARRINPHGGLPSECFVAESNQKEGRNQNSKVKCDP